MESGSLAYRRTMLCMVQGSVLTFALLYSPQALIIPFAADFDIEPPLFGIWTETLPRATLMFLALLAGTALLALGLTRHKEAACSSS